MKLCIPTMNDKGMDAEISGHFGSAPFFMIYDTETKGIKFIDNTNEEHEHGSCTPLGLLGKEGITAVVCGGMGARAVQMLNQGGVKAYRTESEKAADVVAQFTKGGLEELTIDNSCAHHDCH